MIVSASSKRETRRSYGKPKASNSRRFQPAPSPRISLPFESRPPSRPAWPASPARGSSSMQQRPILTRSVAAAIAASVVHASYGPRVDPSGRS